MVGGADYARSTFNRAVRSRRQPGSAFKPLVYAAALAHGYSPVSVLTNLRHVTRARAIPSGRPRSGAGRAAPTQLTLRAALLESNNAAAADLQQRVGIARRAAARERRRAAAVCRTCRRWRSAPAWCSPLDLTAAYTMFPGGGEVGAAARHHQRVRRRRRARSSIVPCEARAAHQPEAVAFQMTCDAARRHRPRHRRRGPLARRRGPVGGKTGTTDDYHDAWFVGFSTSVVVGVWVGFDQPAPIGRDAYGARVALPIWADFMKRTARQLPAREFEVAPGLHGEELCSVSYAATGRGCPTYT